jgi:hypothetical protein
MRRLILAIAWLPLSVVFGGEPVAIPNPALLGQSAVAAQQPMLIGHTHAAQPYDISFDIAQGRIAGLKAKYRKSVPLDDVKQALQQSWGAEPTNKPPVMIWRKAGRNAMLTMGDDGPEVLMLVPQTNSPTKRN